MQLLRYIKSSKMTIEGMEWTVASQRFNNEHKGIYVKYVRRNWKTKNSLALLLKTKDDTGKIKNQLN